MDVTLDQFKRIFIHCPPALAQPYLDGINSSFTEFDINTVNRQAAWFGQIGQESGELRYTEEKWDPERYPSQLRYEPPSSLATRLGNTQKGDGWLYHGRGPIELTGRDNYTRVGNALGLDLVNNPDWAAHANVMFRVAGYFWKSKGLNELADACWFDQITQVINGGQTDSDKRWMYYRLALSVLDV
jgi:predicted chitinase